MALELNNSDDENALSEITSQHGELQEEFDVLTDQLNALVVENEKLQGTVKVLNDKVSIQENVVEELEGHKVQLLEEVENLVAARDEAFASSEQAVVVSQADVEINESKAHTGNEFLTDEVMKFMPFSSQN
jgi:peptidoglycan hydrolase CwlO-like protein